MKEKNFIFSNEASYRKKLNKYQIIEEKKLLFIRKI